MSISIEPYKSNSFSRNKILSSRNRITPLTYNFINFTSQDPFHPINSLLQKNNITQGGWVSNRYCIYPQEILIHFPTKVNIRQINIVSNESKIPKMIEFINCIPVGEKNKFIINNNNNSKIIPSEFIYENIGSIKFSSNTESNYKSRELVKTYVNVNSEYIKLKIHRNYTNSLNMFCQVGIVSLEFLGTKKEIKKKLIIDNNNKNSNINNNESNISIHKNDTVESLFDLCFEEDGMDEKFIDEKMDKTTSDKVKELMEEMNKKKESEEYDECKIIKDKIDKIRKISLKIYTLEEEKKEFANKNDFDKAKEIKFTIEKIKKLLEFYIMDNNYKNQNENNKIIMNKNKINNNRKMFVSKSQEEIKNNDFIEYDEIILPVVLKKIKKNNISSFYNNGENSGESLDNINSGETMEKEPLEELNNDLRNKYDLLICFVGEETLRKIFSKFIYYKEEGFDTLKIKVKEIINEQKNTSEANKYIVMLIDIIYNFLDDKHPSIVYKCLDIFSNILEAIEEKSRKSQVSYDFTITKKILNKIKEKLNDISKKVRKKASDLYCFMLETDFCEYNTLLIELIENEVYSHYNKYLLTINKNNRFKFNLYDNYNSKYEVKSSKQLIITKMDIFLRVLNNFNDAIKKNKTDKQKFPKNILGDFIIMNINHPKDDVREITKDVMVKFIGIFGNNIFKKMQLVINDKELNKIFQDKKELKLAYNNLKNKNNENEDKNQKDININTNSNVNTNSNINVSNSTEGIFLTNVNKKFQNKKNNNKLVPLGKQFSNNIKVNAMSNTDKKMIRSSSQPKFAEFKSKIKLKPIKRNNRNLINSKSQVFEITKK